MWIISFAQFRPHTYKNTHLLWNYPKEIFFIVLFLAYRSLTHTLALFFPGELHATCVLESEFGFIVNCNFKKSSLFRVRNLGGVKAHFGLGKFLIDQMNHIFWCVIFSLSAKKKKNKKICSAWFIWLTFWILWMTLTEKIYYFCA